jgi:hypothetical protein
LSTDLNLNVMAASAMLANVFEDPSTAEDVLGQFGLLNGTQASEISNQAAAGDADAARKTLALALKQFGS